MVRRTEPLKKLREIIEDKVDKTLDFVLKDSRITNIVITTKNNDLELRNYTHNRFLNKQPVISRKIKVDLVYPYNFLKDHKNGEYVLYIDEELSNHSKSF